MKRTELSVGFRGHGESLALLLIRLSKKFLLMWITLILKSGMQKISRDIFET